MSDLCKRHAQDLENATNCDACSLEPLAIRGRLRDEFAMAALTGILANADRWIMEDEGNDEAVSMAYTMAEWMLQERESRYE